MGDYGAVNHDEVRQSISARLDGEDATLSPAEVDAHLAGCADCRGWAATVAAPMPSLPSLEPPGDLTEQVMRAVQSDLNGVGSLRRQQRWLRAGLVAVAVVQLVLSVPVLIFGHDHAAPLHVAHELGSFDAAVALGLLAAARRPRFAAGMLPLMVAITALLMITAGSDLAAGRTDALDEAPHLLDLVGVVLLRRLSVVADGPTGPMGLLVPMATGPRRGPGPVLGQLFVRLRPAAAALGRALAVGLSRVAAVVGLALVTVAAVAGPASAHVVHDGDDPTNWLSRVTGVTPVEPGVAVRVAEAGQRIGLVVSGNASVVVLGFQGEPFLRFASGTVAANTLSPTAQQIVTDLPGTASTVTPGAPHWHVVAHATTWWWHDPRTHFDGYALPPPVASNTGSFVHYQDWRIGLVVDGRPAAINGTLDWVPSHVGSGPWLTGGVLLLATAGIGLLRGWSRPLTVALAAVTIADVLHAVAAASARVGSVGSHLGALPGHGALIAVVWVAAAVACVQAWRRRVAAVYVGLLAAGVMVMVDALPSAAVLWRSQAVTTLSTANAAVLVAAIIGAGGGTAIACLTLMLRLDPAPRQEWSRGSAAHPAGSEPTVAGSG